MKNHCLQINKEQAIDLYAGSSKELQQIFRTTFGEDFYKVDITDKVHNLDTLVGHLGTSPVIFHHPRNGYEKYINACAIIAKVAEIYNQDTILNWNNSSEKKWYAYKDLSSSSGVVYFDYSYYFMFAPGFCYFKDEKLVRKAYENFKEYFEDFWNNK